MEPQPYSPETHGDLVEYLMNHDGTGTDSLFFGPDYFLTICEKGLIRTDFTSLRVNRSPVPDYLYTVNGKFELFSSGQGEMNMSCIGAPEGTYNHEKALKDLFWSIHHLDFSNYFEE